MVFTLAHLLAGMMDAGQVVEFLWILSHVDIIGNKVTDGVAKLARGLDIAYSSASPILISLILSD